MPSDADSGHTGASPPGASLHLSPFNRAARGCGVSVVFGGKVFVMDACGKLTVAGHYGALTVDSSGGYSYALHDALGNAFVQIGDQPCLYIVEPSWSATEVFLIRDGDPHRGVETLQVVISIARH